MFCEAYDYENLKSNVHSESYKMKLRYDYLNWECLLRNGLNRINISWENKFIVWEHDTENREKKKEKEIRSEE